MTQVTLKLWREGKMGSRPDDIPRLTRFVNGLSEYDSIYRSWLKSPTKIMFPLPLSSSESEQWIVRRMNHYEDDGRPWPELGSGLFATHAGPPPYDLREASLASTSIHVGAYGRTDGVYPNWIDMRLSPTRPSTGRPWTASQLRPMMRFAREVWAPAEMCVISSDYLGKIPKTPDPKWAVGERPLRPWIGWITFLPPDLAARAQIPAGFDVETLDDGAILVTISEDPFDVADMARLHALETALRPIQS